LNRGVATVLSKGVFGAAETLSRIEAVLARHRTLAVPTQRLIRRAMSYIHEHYAEPLTREQIARYINISPDYLTDCFHKELGLTPMAYLNRYRIRQARDLLVNSDLKITQIAFAVGFSESAHFTRTFQREVGVTPRAYRCGQRGSVTGDE
jgi:AraC-like DNA-binding protein